MICSWDRGRELHACNCQDADLQSYFAGVEQHTLLLKDEGTLEVAVQSLKDLWNEGRPSMLLDDSIITAQQSLISIILELAEHSGCAVATSLSANRQVARKRALGLQLQAAMAHWCRIAMPALIQ